jgi:hypothetical protein
LDFLSLRARLDAHGIDRPADDAPTLKVALHENLSHGMAEKLNRTTRSIAALAWLSNGSQLTVVNRLFSSITYRGATCYELQLLLFCFCGAMPWPANLRSGI